MPKHDAVFLFIIKVFSPTDAQENCFKRSVKIYIKTTLTFRCKHHHQGAHYLILLRLQLIKLSIKIHRCG